LPTYRAYNRQKVHAENGLSDAISHKNRTKIQNKNDKCKKKRNFFQKKAKIFAYFKIMLYLCTRFRQAAGEKSAFGG
jgi:hypothetical protein